MKRRTRKAIERAKTTDGDYQAYIHTQIHKSLLFARKSWNGPLLLPRTRDLVEKVNRFLPQPRSNQRMLCVGCRHSAELDHIEARCGVRTIGLDLFSEDPRIEIGDMHSMRFGDGEFDALYSCHSLEHAKDPHLAISEFLRVIRDGGLLTIEVPVRFQTSATDLWDVGSVDNLISVLKSSGAVIEVLLAEESDGSGRVIARTHKENVTTQ